MGSHAEGLKGPNLARGVPFASLRDGDLLEGHVGEEPVLLVRQGDNLLAVAARCTHYGAPLADGIVVGDTVRCPWHHACFSLRSGEALAAPAFDPLARWSVERRGDLVLVGQSSRPPRRSAPMTGVESSRAGSLSWAAERRASPRRDAAPPRASSRC